MHADLQKLPSSFAGPARAAPKDAIHVASAIHAGVPTVLSYDTDMLTLNGVIPTDTGTPLRICQPGNENDFILL